MLNNVFFVHTYGSEEYRVREILEQIRVECREEINIFSALSMTLQCQEIVFGLQTITSETSRILAKTLRAAGIVRREIVIPHCFYRRGTGRTLSRLGVAEIDCPEKDIFQAWAKVLEAESFKLKDGAKNFFVYENEGVFFFQMVAGNAPNLDAWQKEFVAKCLKEGFIYPRVTNVWFEEF